MHVLVKKGERSSIRFLQHTIVNPRDKEAKAREVQYILSRQPNSSHHSFLQRRLAHIRYFAVLPLGMALRAVRVLATHRATAAALPHPLAIGRRAFMSTGASHLFSEPSFPVQRGAVGSEDPAAWLDKYARLDPAEMWKVGSFPLLARSEAATPAKAAAATALSTPEELWDTSGMLSALTDDMPLRDAHGVDELLRELDAAYGYFADSVLKKRRKKMNKHKHRKRKKALRMRTKKN